MNNENYIPLSQKIAFGIGQFANQMFPATLGIFMVVLVQDLGFDPIYWGIIFFIPRLFDAITDPLMGFISDNTKSKWGKRRQYILLGALIMGISFSFMWQLYESNGITYNFWYFLSLSLVFYLGLTIFSIPYVAMGYEMSFDFHERTRLMAIAHFVDSGRGSLRLGFGLLFTTLNYLNLLNLQLENFRFMLLLFAL